LLNWLTDFFPTAIPGSHAQAILDISGDVNALLWHRSELEHILQKTPSALNAAQKLRLAAFDTQLRQTALLIVGAEKGELRRFRLGRYDRSHWWWYLDDLLQEEIMARQRTGKSIPYQHVVSAKRQLSKVAEARASYGGKAKASRDKSKIK
jgi:hypothetical protein